VNLFAGTSVWSLTFRRDRPQSEPEVLALIDAFRGRDTIYVTGLVLQEVLQGFSDPKAPGQIIERFTALPYLTPEVHDHVEAAELRNHCRRSGIQIETVDALLVQLCIRHNLTMLATDKDFAHIARHSPLKLWKH
jgi:predicted nucleic acid-binding protein